MGTSAFKHRIVGYGRSAGNNEAEKRRSRHIVGMASAMKKNRVSARFHPDEPRESAAIAAGDRAAGG
jgi:hypothetical protein